MLCSFCIFISLIYGVPVTPQNVILTQNAITIAAKCNTNAKCNKVFNAKCNNFSTQNKITFLTHNVITQNVIQVGMRSQSTKSEAYSINGTDVCVFKCTQADYW